MLLLHQRWFTADDRYPVQFDALLTAAFWIPMAIALACTAAAVLLWQRRARRDVVPGPVDLGMEREGYRQLLSWIPLVIGLHAAVPLLVAGVQRWLFVPNMALGWTFLGGVLGLMQIVIGLSFLYGALTRVAAAALAVVWIAGVLIFGPIEPLEQSIFLGIAIFLFAAGRGPLAFDRVMKRLHRPFPTLVPRAVTTLRILTGVSIAVLAFTEKLGNVPMGLAFLAEHTFNFFPALGFSGISDRDFILLAGTVELTFGLLLISGAFVRLMILILWLPFNLTLPFLGWTELVGHLPIYGVMALLLIWGGKGEG